MRRPPIAELAELSTLARSVADETERARRLPNVLVAALAESGLLRAGAPGGLELPPGEALRAAEELARGDASAGWCASIAITSSLLFARLSEERRSGIASGVWAPRGRGVRTGDGVVISGRWPFCSGIDHADVLFAGCMIGDEPRPSVVALPTAALEIHDTWRTLGLRGTGSHDASASDVLVGEDAVFSLFDAPLVDRPLYRFPAFGFFALSIGAAALGNARAAIEELVELATVKRSQGSSRTLAERAPTQAAVATAEASLRAARALFYDSVEEAWAAAQDEAPVSVALRTGLRLAATHAVRTSATVVRDLYDLAGGAAIYDDAPLQRRFRDAHTATAHFQVNEASRELPGRLLLDLSSETAML